MSAVPADRCGRVPGFRLWDLPKPWVQNVIDEHPRDGVIKAVVAMVGAESKAVPHGRFALSRRCGFSRMLATGPKYGTAGVSASSEAATEQGQRIGAAVGLLLGSRRVWLLHLVASRPFMLQGPHWLGFSHGSTSKPSIIPLS